MKYVLIMIALLFFGCEKDATSDVEPKTNDAVETKEKTEKPENVEQPATGKVALSKAGLYSRALWPLKEAAKDPEYFVGAMTQLGASAYLTGNHDLAIELHRYYRPMGQCSRDHRPKNVAYQYRDLCASQGHLECSVALELRVLAWRLPRVSDMYIGGRPATYDASFDDLPSTMNIERFVRGVLFDYPSTPESERASISPHFFGLALAQSEHKDRVVQRLEAYLKDTALDSWNRHRVTHALYAVAAFEGTEDRIDAARRISALPGVPAVTKHGFDARIIEMEADSKATD